MKANVKKPTMKEKFANAMFGQIVETLLNQYDKSKEKETMSFEEYARYLVDLGNKKMSGEEIVNEIDEPPDKEI